MNQLTIGNIITNAIQLGVKNMASIVGAVILWLLTIWIPYLNVGTTIAMVGLVIALSKGGVISPLEIFDSKYRKNMGEFFLLIAFLWIGTSAGYVFIIIPGIVIGLAWSQAIYLLLDKNMNPTEALSISNQITYGKKWTIFLANFILAIALIIAIYILVNMFGLIAEVLGVIAGLIGAVAFFAIMMASSAYIYGELGKELENEVSEA